MKIFERLPHTADIKLKIFGKDRRELFANACLALAQILKPAVAQEKPKKTWHKHSIKVWAPQLDLLLADFLQEVLLLSDINNIVYPRVKIEILQEEKLEGTLWGKSVQSFDQDVKAVTYNDLEVKKVNDHWQAVIVFDI